MTQSDPRMVIAYLLASVAICVLVVATSPGAVRTSHSAGEDNGRFPEVSHRTSVVRPGVAITGNVRLADGASASATSVVSTSAPRTATATWCAPTPRYCHGWDTAYVGARWSFRWGDKPYAVQVCGIGYGCTVVRVVSFCACRDRKGIDLSLPAWREIGAPFGLGRIDVTIRRVPTLPATDYGGKP